MSKHRKHERKQRAQVATPDHGEKEGEAREKISSTEGAPLTQSQETPAVRENPDALATELATSIASNDQDEKPQLATVLEEEKRAQQNERKEKDALKQKLQEAEQEMNRLIKALEREKRETERQRLHYESRMKELEQRVAAAQAARRASSSSDESEDDGLASAKAAFRIDLYPHQGQFQGKIEHTLTHDKRAFRGIDEAAIGAFIAAHLPPLENKAEELQKLAALHAVEKPQPDSPATTSAATPQTSPCTPHQVPLVSVATNMHLVLAGRRSRTNMLPCDHSFDVEVDFRDQFDAGNKPWDCEVTLFAKRIEGGPRLNVGAAAFRLAATKHASPLRVPGVRLSCPGIYRLEALVNLKNTAAPESAYSLHANRLVQIQ